LTGISAAALCALACVFAWSAASAWKTAGDRRAETARALSAYIGMDIASDAAAPGSFDAGKTQRPGAPAGAAAGETRDRGEPYASAKEGKASGEIDAPADEMPGRDGTAAKAGKGKTQDNGVTPAGAAAGDARGRGEPYASAKEGKASGEIDAPADEAPGRDGTAAKAGKGKPPGNGAPVSAEVGSRDKSGAAEEKARGQGGVSASGPESKPPGNGAPVSAEAGSRDKSGAANANAGRFGAYRDGAFPAGFPELGAAAAFAGGRARSEVRGGGRSACLWDDRPPFVVYAGGADGSAAEFWSFPEATAYARRNGPSFIYYGKNAGLIWQNAAPTRGRASVAAPGIPQLPELPRGCEVTSLAMLLNFYGVGADKLELAEKIKKNGEPYRAADGAIYYGDPNDGFVGDIYSGAGEGLGVYHAPVAELLSEYMPRAAADLTGCDFSDLFFLLESGAPVWVIVNSTYAVLPESAFQTWQTPNGPIKVTYYEHSVLVTGYDNGYVYFNDPLCMAAKARRGEFIAAWEQMGRQAVACAPEY